MYTFTGLACIIFTCAQPSNSFPQFSFLWLTFYTNPSSSLMFQHGQFPFTEEAITLKKDSSSKTYVDLIVMQRSCSSFLVSVNLVSPAFADAIIPALLTKESVKVDFPWST